MKEEIVWIDVLKGLGIIFVVYGHVYDNYLRDFFFMFHMPLFFFLGGYLFRPSCNTQEYMKKKAIHLLIPYVAFMLVLYWPAMYSAVTSRDAPLEATLDVFTDMAMGGRALVGWMAVFWFVTCFFMTQQVINWLIKRCTERVMIAIMIVSMMLSYANQFADRSFWLPWNLNVVVAAAPFFYAGYWVKVKELNWASAKVWGPATIVALAAMVALSLTPRMQFDMKYALYGLPVIGFVIPIAITLVLMRLTRLMDDIAYVTPALKMLGKASMVIMFLHYPILSIWQHYFHHQADVACVIASIALPLCVYRICQYSCITRIFFIGSVNDIYRLRSSSEGTYSR